MGRNQRDEPQQANISDVALSTCSGSATINKLIDAVEDGGYVTGA